MSLSVVVDDREPPEVAAALRHHADVESVTVRRLAAGDVVAEDVGIERKTSGDYLGSAFGRGGTDLESQVRKLIESYAHGYVLLEADLADVEQRGASCRGPSERRGTTREPHGRVKLGGTAREQGPGVRATSVRGSIASITARFGVPVIPCGDRERLVDLAVRLARKHTDEPSVRSLSPGSVPGREEPIAARMYSCVEGIGPTTAAALHDAYPTVESLLAATKEDLLTVDGVGPVRAEAVYRAVRCPE